MSVLLDDLRQQIAERNAVAIVGAGVSVLATGRAPCASWTGLLHDGAARCTDLNPDLAGKWREVVDWEIDSGDLDNMLSAAEKITRKLGSGEYRRWLRESVGSLTIKDAAVIDELVGLGIPIGTTNYDGLIEKAIGLPAVTWRERAKVERVLRGNDAGVLHLHGYWEDPASVILGIRSYETVLGDEHAQTVLKALSTMKTLVFIGFGAGLGDPNFGKLLSWTGRVFAGSEYRRFRLARDGERGEVQKQHPSEQRIFVLGYGEDYGDLPAFLRQLAAAKPILAAEPLAVATSPATLPGLPRCFGRDTERESLVANLLSERPQPMPILGPAGIGKTTLSLAALYDQQVAARYGAHRYFIRCDGAKSQPALAAAIGAALGLPPGPQIEAASLQRLSESQTVVVLDNLETPWEADQLAVEDFLGRLAALSGLALIVSIRGNERPAGVAWLDALRPNPLDLAAARQMFLSIAGRHFESDQRLDLLVNALDRIPLAIELLAHQAEPEPDLTDLWERWQQERVAILRRADASDRLTNLELSYELSFTSKRMTDDARRLLSVLALLPNGVARKDLAAVSPVAPLPATAALRRSGLAFGEADRLRVLAPVRDYVQAKHPAADADLENAVRFYVQLAREHGPKVGAEGGKEAVTALSADAANVEEMIGRGLSGAAADAVAAAIGMGRYSRFTGAGGGQALSACAQWAHHAGQVLSESNCLKTLGDIAWTRSDHEQARSRYEEALLLYRRVGDVLGEANCIKSLGDIAFDRSDHEQARSRYEEVLPLYRRVGSVVGEANCIQSLGDIALRRSDHEQARSRYEEALALYRRVGAVLGEANCTESLGDIALARSDQEQARIRYEEALALYRRVGAVMGEANCIKGLGNIALRRSEHEQARSRYEEALPLYRRVGDVLGEANCIQGLGDIAVKQSGPNQARELFRNALPLYERISEPYSIGWAHVRLARLSPPGPDRLQHLAAARACFTQIDRPDQLKQLDDEFNAGSETAIR
jgi:tetratricopeptide (TPR) repeat protein